MTPRIMKENHAAPAEVARLGRGPLSASTLIHFWRQRAVLPPNLDRRVREAHATVIAELTTQYKPKV